MVAEVEFSQSSAAVQLVQAFAAKLVRTDPSVGIVAVLALERTGPWQPVASSEQVAVAVGVGAEEPVAAASSAALVKAQRDPLDASVEKVELLPEMKMDLLLPLKLPAPAIAQDESELLVRATLLV